MTFIRQMLLCTNTHTLGQAISGDGCVQGSLSSLHRIQVKKYWSWRMKASKFIRRSLFYLMKALFNFIKFSFYHQENNEKVMLDKLTFCFFSAIEGCPITIVLLTFQSLSKPAEAHPSPESYY